MLMPRVRRVSSRTRSLNRRIALGAMRRLGFLADVKLKPRNFRCHGRATGFRGDPPVGCPRLGAATIGDLDRSGINDVLVGTVGGVSVLLGDGLGGFFSTRDFATAGGAGVVLGDATGDGEPDVITAGVGVSILSGSGARRGGG